MVLKPNPVSLERFTWIPYEHMLVVEASDLGRIDQQIFGQVYDDACDEGFTIVSHHTGREVVYGVEHIEAREGDLIYWELKPAKRGEKHHPTVRVYND